MPYSRNTLGTRYLFGVAGQGPLLMLSLLMWRLLPYPGNRGARRVLLFDLSYLTLLFLYAK